MAEPTLEETFGEKVRQLRTALRWSQEDLANAVARKGVRLHQTQIGKIEAGQRPTRLNEAGVLASVLGVTLPSLLDGPERALEDLYAFGWRAGYQAAESHVLAALSKHREVER